MKPAELEQRVLDSLSSDGPFHTVDAATVADHFGISAARARGIMIRLENRGLLRSCIYGKRRYWMRAPAPATVEQDGEQGDA